MAKYSLYKLLRKNFGNMLFLKYKINIDFLGGLFAIKSSVQQKPSWVKNGVIAWV